MSELISQVSKWLGSLLLLILTVFLCVGCNKMEDKIWINKMLSEMEVAWIEADKAGEGDAGRRKAVSLIAAKYFRPGMPMAEASVLLNQLKLHEFSISEERHEGGRIWPNGEFKSYENKKIKKGISRFIAKKDPYGRERLIISKGVSILLSIDTTKAIVIDVDADIWASAI